MAQGDIVVNIVIKGGGHTGEDCLVWLRQAGANMNEVEKTPGHMHGKDLHVAFKLPGNRKDVMARFLREAKSHTGVTGSAQQENDKGKMKNIRL